MTPSKHLGFSDYERLSGDLAPLVSLQKIDLALCQDLFS
jgi:hypothetical protein